jgi:UDP-N-acetyl-2-amino-2-deoxyglucuronate dehydrogenase
MSGTRADGAASERTTAGDPPPDLAVAIIGCGIIGVNHARAIARVPGLSIAAVVDTVPAARSGLADLVEDELGLARPQECADLSSVPEVTGLAVVCTPSGTHLDIAGAAIDRGMHVVLEKPLEVSVTRGRRLAALAADARGRGLVVSVISQHRFDAASEAVAEAAGAGRLGRLTSAVASVPWWRTQDYYDSGAWRGTWRLDGGGALMNQGVHTVDLLLWFLGRPVEVVAQRGRLAHERIEVEDVVVATVTFESGALAVLHATTAAFPGLPVRVAVHGSAGSAVVEGDRLGALYTDGSDVERSADAVAPEDRVGARGRPDDFIDGHARQYRDIADAIRQGRPPRVGAEEALLALAVVRGAYASAALGRAVRIDDLLDGTLDDAVGEAADGGEEES